MHWQKMFSPIFSFKRAGGLLAPYGSLPMTVYSKQIPNMAGDLLCLTRHFTQYMEPGLYCQVQDNSEAWSLQVNYLDLRVRSAKSHPQALFQRKRRSCLNSFQTWLLSTLTRQFGKKLEADCSIALCRLECQLTQQSSLTPSNFKEVWNLTLATACSFCTETSSYVQNSPFVSFMNFDLRVWHHYYVQYSIANSKTLNKGRKLLDICTSTSEMEPNDTKSSSIC